ncbi:MAG: prepilin-type N-terminal cleavage/methylation domain-containing protein [Opitutaceae bacterium]|nr:prepilin-type N-terminal cleavage/methylation domain-containing protein [Opitutaceae bacterium]
MDFTTTSTPRIEPRRPAAAFTLAEVMIAAALSTVILAGVMSAFLFIGRTGFSAGNYSEMEAQVRRALDLFANDARMAQDIRWHSAQHVTLYLPAAGGGSRAVTYLYEPGTGAAAAGNFYRIPGEAGAALPRQVLVRNVAPDFAFQRFKLEPTGAAANDLETKLLQVSFRAIREGVTVNTASQAAHSARHVLRNKRVGN